MKRHGMRAVRHARKVWATVPAAMRVYLQSYPISKEKPCSWYDDYIRWASTSTGHWTNYNDHCRWYRAFEILFRYDSLFPKYAFTNEV